MNIFEHEYNIGYKKPPSQYQWQKGKSGNPKGRPKKAERYRPASEEDLRDIFIGLAMEEAEFIENGRKFKVPRIELIYRQMLNMAMKGDMKAIKFVTKEMNKKTHENDKVRLPLMYKLFDLEEQLKEIEIGSLEYYTVQNARFKYKSLMRQSEGIDDWPFEEGEPRNEDEWKYFRKIRKHLEKNDTSIAEWPPLYQK